ncbi:Piso0_002395 [Millerozyma farinosa CBS 7064]|uniref:Piso0_002395 protein n=1 Tax=Pichia sorbitophila (strain ATCC MYA-4447 / BCRC 22081 / CBS 7064 / NBRC 10061 / NRRL Y-12695) TaxID=559304 RepID=G8YCH9_PICSO|nr:Piso0_002395 [Millerozyma farinosa CBS 7064]
MGYSSRTNSSNIDAVLFRNIFFTSDGATDDAVDRKLERRSSTIEKGDKVGRRTSIIKSIPRVEEYTSEDLKEANYRRIVDSFISIYVSIDGERKVVYVSDVVHADSNPEFHSVSMPSLGIDERTSLGVQLWCWSIKCGRWILHYEYKVRVRELRRLDEDDVAQDRIQANNAAVLKVNGQYYTLASCLANMRSRSKQDRTDDSRYVAWSYGFDEIRSLQNIARALNDVTGSKWGLAQQIDALASRRAQDTHLAVLEDDADLYLREHELHCDTLDKYTSGRKRQNDALRAQILSHEMRLDEHRSLLRSRLRASNDTTATQIELLESQLDSIRISFYEDIYPAIIARLQEYASSLRDFLSIENSPSGLGVRFCIVGFEFPSSIKELLDTCYYNKNSVRNHNLEGPTASSGQSMSHTDKIAQINACLVFMAHSVRTLADIAAAELVYPIINTAGQPYICDRFMGSARARYPLWYSHDQTVKQPSSAGLSSTMCNPGFEKALDLFNKTLVALISDISQLYSHFHHSSLPSSPAYVPVDCLDNFLWNLQYLLLFMTAPASN